VWDRGPMWIKARVTQIWAFCVPAVVSVIRDGYVSCGWAALMGCSPREDGVG
jgi:hypothetical protein